jgi:thioredoxin 1
MMSPIIDELTAEMKEKADIYKVDVEAEGSLANRYQIMSMPTFLVFKKGEIAKQFNGVTQKEELKAALE